MSNALNDTSFFKVANRLRDVSESATLKLNAQAQALAAKGIDVVNLTAGEPDFNVPEAAKAAAIEAVKNNLSKYTPVTGVPELKKLIAEKTNGQQPSLSSRSPWKPSNVVVTNGGKQALFNLLLASVNPGDEVLIGAPFWLSYPEMVKACEGTPVIVATEAKNRYKLTPQALERAITSRTKWLVLNSPSNPTGVMYSKTELTALGRVLLSEKGRNVGVITDEIYDRLVFSNEPFCSFLEANPELANRTVTVNGLSKSAAMTGWRLGWAVASEPIIQAMQIVQGQSTSGVSSLTQAAAIAALKIPESEFASWVESFKSRRDLVCKALKERCPNLSAVQPDGAFYVWIDVSRALLPGEGSMDFCARLLDEAQVAAVPGGPFGDDHAIRISFALKVERLTEALSRIEKFCSQPARMKGISK